ncbi:hypothetical protein K402DRAFT_391242 [Aulographum hederae CBS 113979]|uniref:C2H2-type domain-containing protein n=1 Tax=Aulographum hederae CBS 113979 TaxID=1176131 RepID=A0A6G1H7Q4_9PEZI|nr:hypothetical protein K402DRAFT_391242 [Aulographum hederae CBS 113979]
MEGPLVDDQSSTVANSVSGDPLKCHHPGCKSSPIFKRKYDLWRHMKKHNPNTLRHNCPAVNCKFRGAKGFCRLDKLFDHAICHNEQTLFHCAIGRCTVGPLPRWLLFLHLNSVHGFDELNPRQYGIRGSMRFNEGSLQFIADIFIVCPLRNCSQSIESYGSKHIATHTMQQLLADESAVKSCGFDPRTQSLRCLVPSCNFVCRNSEAGLEGMRREIQLHALYGHVVSDSDHFFRCIEDIGDALLKMECNGSRDQVVCEIAKKDPFLRELMSFLDIAPSSGRAFVQSPPWRPISWRLGNCSFCGHDDLANHVRGLIKEPKDLSPIREQLSKMWPEFGFHPVFGDITRVSRNSGSGPS